jgi:hypothetical protein
VNFRRTFFYKINEIDLSVGKEDFINWLAVESTRGNCNLLMSEEVYN